MTDTKKPEPVVAGHPVAFSQFHPISPATKSQIRAFKDEYNMVDPMNRFIQLSEEMTEDGRELMRILFLESDENGDFTYDSCKDVFFLTADVDTSDYVRQIVERMVRA